MSSNALETQGTVLKLGDGASPEVFTAISEIRSFQGPGGQAQVIDVTDLASTAREKRMGIADSGQLSFDINYIPTNTQHAALRTNWNNRTSVNFQLLFTDSPATQWDFSGFVLAFTTSGGVDAVLEASVTIEITGAITQV